MKFDEVRCEFKLDGRWVNLNAYRLQNVPITASFGFAGNGPLDRVASTGRLSLTLLNQTGLFTPGGSNCMSGFETGMAFRLRLAYQGRVKTRFYGTVPPNGIQIHYAQGLLTTAVTVVDYMDKLATHELALPAYTTNKRMDEVLALILANMPVQPLSTSFGTGKSTFTSVFDTLNEKTRALSEVSKLALSEMGYVFVKSSETSDEVLVMQERAARSHQDIATIQVPIDGSESGRIAENGDTRVTEESWPRETQPLFTPQVAWQFDAFTDITLQHAGHYYNQVKATSCPRKVDINNVVLFNLERPLQVAAGDTVTLNGRFRDPNQLAQSVAALSTVTPVATTDYLFNTAQDGTGTNITADLEVTATYGANGVDYALKNNNASTGYVTFLQARGKGVYLYRPIEKVDKDAALIAADGTRQLTITQPYQDNPLETTDIATITLDTYSQKVTTVESVTISAHRVNTEIFSEDMAMCAFLDLQIGDKVEILSSTVNMNKGCFIQRMEFSIGAGDVATYKLHFIDSLYETFEIWILGDATASVLDTTTVLGF